MNLSSDQSFFNPAFFKGLYDGVSDAVFIVNRNHQIQYANPSALSLISSEFFQIHNQKIGIDSLTTNGPISGKFNIKTLGFFPDPFMEDSSDLEFRSIRLTSSMLKFGKTEFFVFILQPEIHENKEIIFQHALLEIAHASNYAFNLDKFYREIHQILRKYIKADNFYIAIYDQDAQFIRFPYYIDERDYLQPGEELIKARNRKKKRGLTEYLLVYGEPLLLTEEDILNLSSQEELSIIGSLPKYWLGAPLKNAAGEILGGLAVQSYQSQFIYTQSDKTLLSFIASHVAINLERKQIEEKLKIERDLFTNSPVVIFKLLIEKNQPVKTIYVSNNIRQFGYQPKEFLSGKRNYEQIVFPQDRALVLNDENMVFTNSRAHRGEKYRILTADGQVRWVFDFTYVYKHENEDFVEYNFYILDITEQKETEAQLKILNEELESRVKERTIQLSEAQDFLQMVINTIPVPIYYKNEFGTYLDCNTAYEQLTGQTKQNLIGKNAFDVWPADTAKQYHEMDIELIKLGGQTSYEMTIFAKTGQKSETIVRKAAFKNANGEITGLVSALLDITERKRTEQLQNVLYRISEAAGSTDDIDSLYAFVHEIVKQLIPAKNFYIALYNQELDMVHFPYYKDEVIQEPPPPRKIRFGMTERVIHGKKALFMTKEKMEETFKKANIMPRGQLPYQWLGVPLKTQKDKIIGVIAVQSYDQSEISYTKDDQTLLQIISRQIATAIERKQTQEQLRLLNKELEAKVYDRTQQLNAQLLEVKQREHELTAIVEIAQALRQIERPEQIYSIVLNLLNNTMEAEGCSIAVLDETQNEIHFVNASGVFTQQKNLVLPVETGAAGWVIRNKKTYVNNNAQREPGLAILKYAGGMNALLVAPMIMENRVFGLLEVGANHIWTEDDQRLLVAIAEIAANAIHRELLDSQREKQLNRLNTLREIDRMITGKIDLYDSLSFLLNQIVKQLSIDAADILLSVSSSTFLDFGRGFGFRQVQDRESLVSVRQGPAEAAISCDEPLLILDIQHSQTWQEYFSELNAEKFVFYYAIPLKTKGQVLGVLELFHRSPLSIDEDWLDFAFALSQQTAIAIENAQLFDKLQKVNRDLLFAYDKTIAGWAKALELRDQETGGHSVKVTEMTIKLAQLMGIRDAEELTHIRRGALLHDIGKMAIPDNILLKPEKLTEKELLEMKKHPKYAWELLYPIEFLRPALDIPLYHHERWDGSGYPYGLKGQEIPFPARIFAVIDVFHALISDRPYSEAWRVEDALKYIVDNKGKLFDPDVVNQFIRVLKTSGFLG